MEGETPLNNRQSSPAKQLAMSALEMLSNDKVCTIGMENAVLPVVPPIKTKVPTTFRAINPEY